MKEFAKACLPPLLANYVRILLRTGNRFTGSFSSWDEARFVSSGYDAPEILDRCRKTLLRVKSGEAACERDSVLFAEAQHSWPVLASLSRAALEDERLDILDFGGSLGSSYFQYRSCLQAAQSLRWSVVEQPHFVACGRAEFEDECLRFYSSVQECLRERQPNVLLLSSVLQYLPDPRAAVDDLIEAKIPWLIVDRTPLTKNETCLCVQKVDPSIYRASYPCWIFNENQFYSWFHKGKIICRFHFHHDKFYTSRGKPFSLKGFIVKFD